MSTMVEVTAVDQVFRTGFWLKPVRVLQDVNLVVPRGSTFGFLGENGAGKTTLIHLIAGLRRPARGSVRVGGVDAGLPPARARIGYLPERPFFHDHLTSEGLLRYFGALSGMSRGELLRRVPEALTTVGLAHAARTELRKFSKGMLQRIGIAQAILHEPELLILDEPMSGLDPVGRKEIRELIQGLAAQGRTVFFSSHVIPDVEALCDRVAVIRRGRLVASGSIDELLAGQVRETEIAFTGIALEGVRAIVELENLRSLPDGLRASVRRQEDVSPALRALLERGAQVQSVVPVRPTLESLFSGGAS